MVFKNIKLENGYHEIKLENDKTTLSILFGGNGDLYWNISSLRGDASSSPNEYEERYFIITKENNEIFSLFSELYRKIEECDIYKVSQLEEELCFDEEERNRLYEQKESMNRDLLESTEYFHLFPDETIVWHSDDAPYDAGNVLYISPSHNQEIFLIKIIKRDRDKDDFSIEISNSGSRYAPFNTAFMEHYNNLCAIDPNYHQIHIEEILYQKKLSKKNESTN